jgi:hypothetical protein
MSTLPLGRILHSKDIQSQSRPVRVCGKYLPESMRIKNTTLNFPFQLSSGKVLGVEGEEQPFVLHGEDLLLPHCKNTKERLRNLFREASRNPHGFLLCGEGSDCPCTHDASRIVSMRHQNPAASAHHAASDRGH